MNYVILPVQTSMPRQISSTQPRSLGVIICFGLLFALLPAYAEPKPEDAALALQTLEDFNSVEQTSARKPIMDAEASYRSKLEKFQKTAQDAGNLKSVLAAKQAITELDAGRPPVGSDDPEVTAIQKAYVAQRQKAEAETAKALAKVDQDYLVSLRKLVVELTKAGQIDQAQEVQKKVDAFAAVATPNPTVAAGGQELETWIKKAKDEFPALKDTASPLSKRVNALKEAKKSMPNYFKNPQWPYLLAKEANQLEPKVLFNGKDLTGWTVLGDASCFTVQNETLHVDGKGANIFYTGTGSKSPVWKNFDLSFKVKTDHKANSGIWVHAKLDPRDTCALEVQIDNENPTQQRTGSIWSVKPVLEQLARDGEWFDMRVVVKGATITVFLNGRPINEWIQPANWQPPAKIPNARLGEGLIGFQANRGLVWFKDIQIHSLP
jgi:hypothetical protein